ncbi:MAG: serine/threonine protein kinase [Gemmatimonadota bacterium]|nr:MAG: serine/threonine protein kinase [Gemmatimonadota bacterium]
MVSLNPKLAESRDSGATPNQAIASKFLASLSDRYVVDRLLGTGGMGAVYLARDAKLGRPVAIKVVYSEVADRVDPERFLREIRLTAGLQHPHILPVIDSGCVDGVLYYITPYLSEGSLHSLLEREGPLSLERATAIALDVLEALEYAHEQGVVHCDIKPENILLSHGHAILADFGIATTTKTMGRRNREDVWGSPAYVSPEQASGDQSIDGRSDLYSLGCVLYEMLAGSQMFTGANTMEVVAKRFSPPPHLDTVCPSVPRRVAAAVSRAIAVDPDARFSTARALGLELAGALRDPRRPSQSVLRHAGLRPKIARWVRGGTLLLAFLVG